MPAAAGYRLNWNPDLRPGDVSEEMVTQLCKAGFVVLRWRCGNGSIEVGQKIYLLRTGANESRRGLVGVGTAAARPTGNKRGRRVRVRFTRLALEPFVHRSAFDVPPLNEVAWSNQGAAVRLEPQHVAALDALIGERSVDVGPMSEEDARTRQLRAIVERAGQGAFRDMLLEAYGHRCAISDCDAPDALEAAHISPYRGAHTDRIDNGLLLRADLHTLFDRGLLGIDGDDWTVVVAPTLRGTVYGGLAGQRIRAPARACDQPSRELPEGHLRWSGLQRG